MPRPMPRMRCSGFSRTLTSLLLLPVAVVLIKTTPTAEAFGSGAAASAASAGGGGGGATASCPAPTHLAVLVHGYMGHPEDLTYLQEAITKFGNGRVLAYTPRCNLGRTRDGVRAGGERVAEDVRRVVQEHPSLQDVSFVGNSLGGLYTRYALSLLWDGKDRTVAGLRPVSFLTIATPHLGVRRFLALPVPEQLHFTAPFFLGQTGNDLFLRTPGPASSSNDEESKGPLLLRMTHEDSFMAPLAAFKHRRAYGNVKEDLLVPLGTALFSPQSVIGKHWAFKERIVVPDPDTNHATLEVYHLPAVEEEGGAAGLGRTATGMLTGVLMSGSGKGEGTDWMEQAMARRLDGLGWQKIAVEFRFPFLQAHNKICALSRNGVTNYLYRQGRGVVDHAAQLVVDG